MFGGRRGFGVCICVRIRDRVLRRDHIPFEKSVFKPSLIEDVSFVILDNKEDVCAVINIIIRRNFPQEKRLKRTPYHHKLYERQRAHQRLSSSSRLGASSPALDTVIY